ncbi:MAG TPA: sigma-70 family RNA polymerase sigma factor [Solirubrobacteraceae bacterium]
MGYDDAFGTLHDRYRQRLLAYTRQMLGPSRSDAEDVLQDVFLRAYGALRNDDRPVTLRAWLYRVAHNRCIDHLRRPVPPAAEIYELSRTPAHDPQAETVRREDLRHLVQDVQRLPEQQRSALLMRELDGLSYAELADALDTSVPAIKSLLVRARVGLVEAEEARDTACVEIRADLVRAHGRGVRTSGRSRRHLRDCNACREYRQGLRGVDEGLAALVPGGAGPLGAVAKLLGIGGASSGAAAGAGAGAGGTAAVAGGATAATATATKVVAIVCCAAVVGGGAAEVRQQVSPAVAPSSHAARHARKAAPRAAAVAPAPVKAPVARAMDPVRDVEFAAPSVRKPVRHGSAATTPAVAATDPATGSVAAPAAPAPVTAAPEEAQTGGAMAPDEDSMPDPSGTGAVGAPSPDAPGATPGATTSPAAAPTAGANAGAPVDAGAPGAGATPAG